MRLSDIRPEPGFFDDYRAKMEEAKEETGQTEQYGLKEVAIRLVDMPPLLSDIPINNPEAAVKVMAELLKDYDKEVLAVVNLRADLKPVSMNVVSMGAVNESIAHPREILKSVVLSNSTAMMLIHNHPTGNLTPSRMDIEVTDRMSKLCKLMGIEFTDHVIVGPTDNYYSFYENREIPLPELGLKKNVKDIELEGFKVAENIEGPEKKINRNDYKEKQSQEMKAIMEKLEKGVEDVFSSDNYQKLLTVMSKMPHYSLNNQLLIMMQNPRASMCNSFSGWKKVKRYVKAGEKGLRILAPAPYQIEKEQPKRDGQGNIIRDQDGEPVMEKTERTIMAFKPVSTFDISQTGGEDLPQLGVAELVGNIEGYGTLIQAISDISPVPISFENIESNAKGYYHQQEKRIAIKDGMSEAQTVKTALHELAHAKYHSIEAGKEASSNTEEKTRAQKECEAESIAYVCSAHYGLNTSDYSFGYVAGWSSGKEMPELRASLQTIKKAASELITLIDTRIEELVVEKEPMQQQQQEDRSVTKKLADNKAKISEQPKKETMETKQKMQEAI